MFKRERYPLTLLIVAILTLSSGCASIQTVVKSKHNGTNEIYPVTLDQAWDISKTVLRWSGTGAIEEHREDGYMLTNKGATALTWGGTMIGVWVEPVDADNMRVTVVTKRGYQLNFVTGLTETTFHKRYAQAVDIVKSGKPLPIAAP